MSEHNNCMHEPEFNRRADSFTCRHCNRTWGPSHGERFEVINGDRWYFGTGDAQPLYNPLTATTTYTTQNGGTGGVTDEFLQDAVLRRGDRDIIFGGPQR